MKRSGILLLTAVLLCSMLTAVLPVSAGAESDIQIDLHGVPTYTGEEVYPEYSVSLYGEPLTENVDYTVAFSNNINAGTEAKMTVTGLGDYAAYQETVRFPIARCHIADASVQVADVTYSSGPEEPHVTVKTGNVYLDEYDAYYEEGDYQLQYLNNCNIGTATVRVIGINNYYGHIDAMFDICEASSYSLEFGTPIYDDGVTNRNAKMSTIPVGGRFSDSFGKYSKDNGYCKVYKVENGIQKTVASTTISFYSNTYIDYTFEEAGAYIIEYKYNSMMQTGYNQYQSTPVHVMYGVICEMPWTPSDLVAEVPYEFGSKTLYLYPGSTDNQYVIEDPVWESSDPAIATVENGVVTMTGRGAVSVTAKVADMTATWDIQTEALNIATKATFLTDPETGDIQLMYKNELLVEGEDYSLQTTTFNGVTELTVQGCKLFQGEVTHYYYAGTGYSYKCQHTFETPADVVCNQCGETCSGGDIDGNGQLNAMDALLLYGGTNGKVALTDNQLAVGDYNGDGAVNMMDALLVYRRVSGKQ